MARVTIEDVADGVPVEATEVVSGVSGVCPSRTITVRGVQVAVNAQTFYAAPLRCETIAGGKLMKISGLLTFTPGGFAVIATALAEIGAESVAVPDTPRRGEKLSGQGRVNSVSGACPSVRFTIMGHRVEANASTQYSAGACGQLREGADIRLDVDKQPDGTIYAVSIEFLDVSGRGQ
jgi:hypothetical protein